MAKRKTDSTPEQPQSAKKPARKPKAAAPATKPAKTTAKAEKPKREPKPITKRPPKNIQPPVKPEYIPITQQQFEEALADGLTVKEIEFVEVYLTCYNGTKSYMQVYEQTNVGVAAVKASQSFNKDKIRKHLAKRMAALFKRTEEAQETLINQYQAVAYADANELMEYRREACRFCYGEGHKYQYTPQQWRNRQDEYEKAKAEADAANEPIGPLDPEGGVGFDPRREPHPDCPECFGEGRERLVFKDTRHLSPAGLALYTGAKVTKDGIEIKTRSQERAAEMLARILKLYEEKTEVNMNFPIDELQDTFVTRMQKAQAMAEKVRRERQQRLEG